MTNVPSHWQVQIYFTFSTICLTDLLILNNVILLLGAFGQRWFLIIPLALTSSLTYLLKQKIKWFGLRKIFNSKGLMITAYLNALWTFGLKPDCRD